MTNTHDGSHNIEHFGMIQYLFDEDTGMCPKKLRLPGSLKPSRNVLSAPWPPFLRFPTNAGCLALLKAREVGVAAAKPYSREMSMSRSRLWLWDPANGPLAGDRPSLPMSRNVSTMGPAAADAMNDPGKGPINASGVRRRPRELDDLFNIPDDSWG